MPLGPFDPIPVREKVRRSHVNELREALTGVQDAYDVAQANGYTGTQVEWLQSLIGPQGAPGTVPIDEVATVGDLATIVDPAINDVYTVAADGHAYRWNGATWVDIGAFRGPPGDLDAAVGSGATGQSITYVGTTPAAVETVLYPRAFGVVADGTTDDLAAWEAVFAAAVGSKRPAVIEGIGGGSSALSATLDAPYGVNVRGQGTYVGASTAIGTRFIPHASFTTGPAIRVAAGADPYAHSTRITGVYIDGFPGDGLAWEAHFGENAYLGDISANNNGGDGVRITGDATPMLIGAISAHSNGGAGVRLSTTVGTSRIDMITGDANGDALVEIDTLDAQSTVYIETIKAEQSDNGVVRCTDLNGAQVSIGAIRSLGGADLTGPALASALVEQAYTTDAKIPGTIRVLAPAIVYPHNWPEGGYKDGRQGTLVSAFDLNGKGLDTGRTVRLDPFFGRTVERVPAVLTGTVGTSQTTFPHDLGYTPVIAAIIPHTNAQVWRSAAPDADNIYLTASASTAVDVVLERGSRITAMPTVHISDTFTDTNGTTVVAHTPETGGPWESWGSTWTVQGNRALAPFNNAYTLAPNVSSGNVRIEADCFLGTNSGTRSIGIITRFSDNSNHWIVLLDKPGTGGTDVYLHKRVAGTLSTQLFRTPVRPNPAADATVNLVVVMHGTAIRVLVDGAELINAYIGTFNQTAGRHGMQVFSRGSGANLAAIDRFELRKA